MASILYLMIAALSVMLLVFVFWKRTAIFSGGARKKQPVPGPRAKQDMTMRQLVAILLPAEEQSGAKELLSDYSGLSWKAFRKKYVSILDGAGYEEEDFCQDIRSSLLVLWMLEQRLLFLWEEPEQAEAARAYIENRSGVALSDVKGGRNGLMRKWAKELTREGWSLLVLRDPFEGDPLMVLPSEKAALLIGKHVSDLKVLDAALL